MIHHLTDFRMTVKWVTSIILLLIIKVNYVELSTLDSICSVFKSSSNVSKGRYATKTGYSSVPKDHTNWKTFLDETSECTKENVWFISRHGTRYPIADDSKTLAVLPKLTTQIEQNFLDGRGCLHKKDVAQFIRWIPYYDKRHTGQLHEQGAEELFNSGQHWRVLFPEIFSLPYNSKKIKVQFTISNRTGQSAYHFLRGMYGEDAVGLIELPKPKNPDLKLRFHKFCPAWMKNVYRNNNSLFERKLFEKTRHFQATLHAVSARLGFLFPLEKSSFLAIYEECRFETAWYPNEVSIWCMPFTEHDIVVMEFFQDLKYYYEDSYGIELNAGMACETVADLLEKLSSGLSIKPEKKKTCLYFTHDKIILHLFTSLGLFKPYKHLKHSDFEGSKDRIFKTSYISPFGSNLGFGLFKCRDGYKVVTFLQGAPIYMKNICSELLCDWSLFESHLSKFTTTCNFSKTCNIHDEL